MTNNLCPPCTQPKAQDKSEIKYLIYKSQNSNLDDIVENTANKDCRPDFFTEMGNDSYETATDRFSISSYNNIVNKIINGDLIKSPELEDIDETLLVE